MKVLRNISSALIFISAFIAVVHSAAHFSEDEVLNQIREDLLLAKLFNRMEAREQGMTRSVPLSPYSSPLFSPFLPGRSIAGKAVWQKKPSTGSTYVAPREARLQEKALQQFFLRPIQDARAAKYRHPSNIINRIIMATAVEVRVQDYIKDLNQTEYAQKLITGVLTCALKGLPDFTESLKGTKIFGKPASRLLKGYKRLLEMRLSGHDLSFLEGFIPLVTYVLHPDELDAKVMFNFEKLRKLYQGGFKSFARIPEQKGENDTFRNLLNTISILVSSGKLTTENKSRFNTSINFIVERYGFKQIDALEKSEEDKDAMKKALRSAASAVVAAFFKIRNGESLNSGNRISLLRSVITVLVSLNNVSDTPLLQFIDQFLARNPTSEELSIKSQCLILLFLRKSVDYYLNIIIEEKETAEGTGPVQCAVNSMIDVFRIFLKYIPTQVSNVVRGCEDFAAIGYRGVAQEEAKTPIMSSDSALNYLLGR